METKRINILEKTKKMLVENWGTFYGSLAGLLMLSLREYDLISLEIYKTKMNSAVKIVEHFIPSCNYDLLYEFKDITQNNIDKCINRVNCLIVTYKDDAEILRPLNEFKVTRYMILSDILVNLGHYGDSGLCSALKRTLKIYGVNIYPIYDYDLRRFFPEFTFWNALKFKASIFSKITTGYWWYDWKERAKFLKWLIDEYKDDETDLFCLPN